jgi:hypothetical protein
MVLTSAFTAWQAIIAHFALLFSICHIVLITYKYNANPMHHQITGHRKDDVSLSTLS